MKSFLTLLPNDMVDIIRKDANDSLIRLEFKLLDRITSSLLGDSEAP